MYERGDILESPSGHVRGVVMRVTSEGKWPYTLQCTDGLSRPATNDYIKLGHQEYDYKPDVAETQFTLIQDCKLFIEEFLSSPTSLKRQKGRALLERIELWLKYIRR